MWTSRAALEEAQRYLGCLSDFFTLYDDLKVWEYLDYFAHAYKLRPTAIPARIESLLALLGLSSKRDSFIEGLSRGMKLRLGIAPARLGPGHSPMERSERREADCSSFPGCGVPPLRYPLPPDPSLNG